MMNQEDIFKKVGQILNELKDQYDFLAQNPAQLNELELELFLANANFLSDHVQIVKKINSHKPQRAIPEHTEDQSPVVAEVSANEPQMDADKTPEEPEYASANESEPIKFEFKLDDEPSTDKFEFEQQPIETIFDRPLSREEEEIIARKKGSGDSQPEPRPAEEAVSEPGLPVEAEKPATAPLLTADKVEEKVVSAVSTEPVLDKVEEKLVKEPEMNQARPTLNDQLAGKNKFAGNLNDDSNKTPIRDLKQAISLNQKLLFIKDLFNGYNLAYGEAIELINKMPDFKTADAYLQQNYAIKNNWSLKQATVDQFYELLNQRFPKA